MIRNAKQYERAAQKDRAKRLRRLTTTDSSRQLQALVQLGWAHRPRRAQPQPYSLAKLLRAKSAT